MNWYLIIGVVTIVLFGMALLTVPLGTKLRRHNDNQAIRLFQQRREMLEAKFFDMARVQDKPRGLRWLDCDWLNDVTFARDKKSGLLTAFVSINVRFEAIEGGGMEDVAAVSTVRDAVALFHFYRGSWGTGGKALFNMNPQEALEKLVAQFTPVLAS